MEIVRKSGTRQTTIDHKALSSFTSAFINKRPLVLRQRNSVAAQLKPLLVNNQFHYKHKQCEQQYERAMSLRQMNSLQSITKAQGILQQLFFNKMMSYETDEQSYALKEHISLNYWKILQEKGDSNGDFNGERRVLKMLRIAYIYLKTCYQKIMPRSNNLQLLAVILAREEYAAGCLKEALVVCDQAIVLGTHLTKNNTVKLKAHYLKVKIYNKLGETQMQLFQINKCLHFLKNMIGIVSKQEKEAYSNFRKSWIYRKQELLKIKSKNLGFVQEDSNMSGTQGFNYNFNGRGSVSGATGFYRTRSSSLKRGCQTISSDYKKENQVGNGLKGRQTLQSRRSISQVAKRTLSCGNQLTPIKPIKPISSYITSINQERTTKMHGLKNKYFSKVTFPLQIPNHKPFTKNSISRLKIERKNLIDINFDNSKRIELEDALLDSEANQLNNLALRMYILPRPGQLKNKLVLDVGQDIEKKVDEQEIMENLTKTINFTIIQPILKDQCEANIIEKYVKSIQQDFISKYIRYKLQKTQSNSQLEYEVEYRGGNSKHQSVNFDRCGRDFKPSLSETSNLFNPFEIERTEIIQFGDFIFNQKLGFVKRVRMTLSQDTLSPQNRAQQTFLSMANPSEPCYDSKFLLNGTVLFQNYNCVKVSQQLDNVNQNNHIMADFMDRLNKFDQESIVYSRVEEKVVVFLRRYLRLRGTERIVCEHESVQTKFEDSKYRLDRIYLYQQHIETIKLIKERKNRLETQQQMKSSSKDKIYSENPLKLPVSTQTYISIQIVNQTKLQPKLITVKFDRSQRLRILLRKSQNLESLQSCFQRKNPEKDTPRSVCEKETIIKDKVQHSNTESCVLDRIIRRITIYFTNHQNLVNTQGEIFLYDSMKYLLVQSNSTKTQLERFFDCMSVQLLCKIQQLDYFVRVTQYKAKRLYSSRQESFYRFQMYKNAVNTRKMLLIVTDKDLEKATTQNESSYHFDFTSSQVFDNLVAFSKNLIVKRDTVYEKIGLAKQNSKFYLKNYFRTSCERKNRISNSFLQLQLTSLQVLCQKLTILKIQNSSPSNSSQRFDSISFTSNLYALITVSTMFNCQIYQLKIYLPTIGRNYSLNFDQRIVQYFDEKFNKEVFGDIMEHWKIDGNGDKEDNFMMKCNQVLFGRKGNRRETLQCWRRILSRVEYETMEFGEWKYLIVKISNYKAFIKDCSLSSYISVQKSVVHLQISLECKHQSINFTNYNNKILNKNQPHISNNIKRPNNHVEHNNILSSFTNLSQQQTKDCLVYISMTNIYSTKRINFYYTLKDILKLIKVQKLGYITMKTSKVFLPQTKVTECFMEGSSNMQQLYNQFCEPTFSYARVLRGFEVLKEKIVDGLTDMFSIHKFFTNQNREQQVFNEKINREIENYNGKNGEYKTYNLQQHERMRRSAKTIRMSSKSKKLGGKTSILVCLQWNILDVKEKKVSCIFYDTQSRHVKVNVFNNTNFSHKTLQIVNQKQGYPFLQLYNGEHLKAMRKRICKYSKNKILIS